MGHNHAHQSAGMKNRGRLAITFSLGICILVVQLIGAAISGSLALLADSVHVFADSFGVGLALLAVTVAGRSTKPKRTFGLYRIEILATVFNGVLLLALAGFILYEAWERWNNPSEVAAPAMFVAALFGLLANLVGVLLLRRGAGESLTVKGAYLEVLSDAVGSLGVVLAAVVIWFTGWNLVDVLVSLGIAIFIIPRTIMLLRDAFSVLMESAPPDLDLVEVRKHILAVDGVIELHDLHAWTITSGMPSLSAHVLVDPDPYRDGSGSDVLLRLQSCVAECFGIIHTTFQLESKAHVEREESRHP